MISIRRNLDLNPGNECVERCGVVRGWQGAARDGAPNGTSYGVAHGMAEREPKQRVSRQRGGASGWCRRSAHG
jgi:hypothetical protein